MDTNTTPYSAFKTILSYSIFILASPIITFFASQIILVDIFGTSPMTANVSSAVLAVVVLHIAVGMYIYKAYSEADKVKEQ